MSSHLDAPVHYDHTVLFSDIQCLTKLKSRLSTSTAAVNGQLKVLQGWNRQHTLLCGTRSACDANNTVAHLKIEIEHTQDAFRRLMRKANEYRKLLDSILTTRTNAALLLSITHMQTNINLHRATTDQMHTRTIELVRTAKEGHQDTMNVKTLAQIATLFLPATLIAVKNPSVCV